MQSSLVDERVGRAADAKYTGFPRFIYRPLPYASPAVSARGFSNPVTSSLKGSPA